MMTSQSKPSDDYLAMMFANTCDPETDHDTIKTRYGPHIAIYATINQALFRMQRKYRELFTGPLARHIECCGTMAPLLVFGVQIMPAQQCTIDPSKYYANVFAEDVSSIKVRQISENSASIAAMEPILYVFRTLRFERTVPPPVGSSAIVSRDVFATRLAALMRMRDGTPDVALQSIFDRAGVCPKVESGAGAPIDALSALERANTNYCIAGGFISKLLDPSTKTADFIRSDVDVFVYGENQEQTIDKLVEQLFVPEKTFITVRGSVVTIYRTNAMKVQIVSSACGSPCRVISEFDLAHVMAYWSNGTVFVNAKFLRAFATRTCKFKHPTDNRNDMRLAKLIRAGFRICANTDERKRLRILDQVGNYDKLWSGILAYIAHVDLDDSMPESEKIARIIHHDGVLDVITNVVSSGPRDPARDARDPPARISQLVLLKRTIAGYSSMNMSDVEWQMVSVRKFPTVVGMQEAIQVAGFRARIVLATIGKIDPSSGRASGGQDIYILSPESSKRFLEMVEICNTKLRSNDLGKLEVPMTVSDGVVSIVAARAKTLLAPTAHRGSLNIHVSLSVKYKGNKVWDLVLTQTF